MMQGSKLIILASGNSVPFPDNKPDPKLVEVIQNNVSFGINYFSNFYCEPTLSIFCDYQFYRDNIEWLKDQKLIIGKKDDQLSKLNILIDNTILLKSGRYYVGDYAWHQNELMCLNCKRLYKGQEDGLRKCEDCFTHLMQPGFYHAHLSSMFSLSIGIALGFKEIYLLGSDAKEINGKTHFYQDLIPTDEMKLAKRFRGVGKRLKKNKDAYDYCTCTYNNPDQLNDKWFEPFGHLKDITIYNVSLQSVINIFPKIDYDTFYEKIGNNKINQDQTRSEIKSIILDKLK